MVLVQKWAFLQLFFLGNIGQENIFYDILERKNSFLDYKNNKLKKSKNRHFSPIVLVQKWPCFKFYFLGIKGQENVFYDILERENAVLGYKSKKFKKAKNQHFSKGVHPSFWSKNHHFSNFFF